MNPQNGLPGFPKLKKPIKFFQDRRSKKNIPPSKETETGIADAGTTFNGKMAQYQLYRTANSALNLEEIWCLNSDPEALLPH